MTPWPGGGRRVAAALACALLALGQPPSSLAQPQQEGVNVHKSRLALLPASMVDRSAAQQYQQMMRAADEKRLLNTDRRELERLRNIARALIPQSARFNASASRWNWEVNLVRSPQVNAFCMPGGKIAFFSGILDGLKLTDAEVAAVMGHEIAHALLEHGRARMSEQVLKNVGITAAAAMLHLGQDSTRLLAGAANVVLTLPFSRAHETDADLVGIELAARAGYDPRAAVTLWQKMQRLSAQSGGGQPPQFMSTHPSHESRIRQIEANLPRVLPLYEATPR